MTSYADAAAESACSTSWSLIPQLGLGGGGGGGGVKSARFAEAAQLSPEVLGIFDFVGADGVGAAAASAAKSLKYSTAAWSSGTVQAPTQTFRWFVPVTKTFRSGFDSFTIDPK